MYQGKMSSERESELRKYLSTKARPKPRPVVIEKIVDIVNDMRSGKIKGTERVLKTGAVLTYFDVLELYGCFDFLTDEPDYKKRMEWLREYLK